MQSFIVRLADLPRGRSLLELSFGREFFDSFGNSEVLDADLKAVLHVDNHSLTVDVACEISGSVTVECDRCLEDLEIPVETSFEESYAPQTDELDLSQDIYDYILVSLPMQRVHPDGGCNGETIKYLSK